MSDTALRTQAQLGSLKWLAGGVLLGALILGVIEIGQIITAMKNPSDPQSVMLEQLVNGSIGAERYATVSGYAMYDVGYAKTMDGQKYNVFYALLDDQTGYLILVEAPTALIMGVIAGTCVIPFFVPSVVFAPMPTDLAAVQSQANGKSLKLKRQGGLCSRHS